MKLVSQGPNHAAYAFGELTVIALRDGYVDMPASRLQEQPGSALDTASSHVSLIGGKLRLSVNAFAIVGGGNVVLLDTGASDSWLPSMGGLPQAMTEAGIDRKNVTHVAVTHTHEDHVNGLISPDGSETFPNAKHIYVPKAEIPEITGRLAPIKNRVVPIEEGVQITKHITATDAWGHSIGHTAYQVASGAETLLVWGDIVHVPAVQFSRPEITWELDEDQYEARRVRKAILENAAKSNLFIAGAHLDFPGIGRVTESDKTSYIFHPVSYSDDPRA